MITGNLRSSAMAYERGKVVVVLLLAALAPSTRAAQQWLDTGTAAGCQPATNGAVSWADAGGDSIWANTSAGTTTPVAWGSGNDAFFTVAGASTVAVNTATAGGLNFSAGPWSFLRGSGNLTINSGITNSQTVLFGNGITLGANQVWHQSANTMTVTGAVSGASYTLTKSGNAALVVSNANNSLGGLVVNSGTVRAYNGGNVLGGASTPITLGQTDQTSVATLQLDTTVAGATTFAMGALTNAAAAQLRLNTAAAGYTNILAASALARMPGVGATLTLCPQNGLGTREQVTFGSAPAPVNGMLGPWIANSNSANFVTYGAAGLTDVVYDATQANAWDANKKVNITGTATVTGTTNVYAMKVGANVTVNSGAILNNASGGFILSAGNVLGGGTVSVGASELLAYVTGTRSFTPVIDGSGGLTLWGGGTLTLSNMTYTGDTWINQGTLGVAPSSDQSYAGAINGLGALSLGGPGTLTLTGTNTLVGGLTANTGFTLGLNGALSTTNTASFWSSSGNTGMVGSANAAGQGGTWDLRKQTLAVCAATSLSNNLLTVNNVTVTNVGTLAIANYAWDNANGLIVSNGARIYGGNVNVGTGSGNNTYSYNNFYQVGGDGAPVTAVHGAVVLGSCYYDNGATKASERNRLIVTNANLTLTGLTAGFRQSTNNFASVLANATVNMSGGAIALASSDTSGNGPMYGNSLTIDNGVVTNAGGVTIGGAGSGPSSTRANANYVSVSNGGQFYSGNVTVGARSYDSNNVYRVGGPGAASFVSNGVITVNSAGTMTVTNATLRSGDLTVATGSTLTANNSTLSSGKIALSSGGTLTLADAALNSSGSLLLGITPAGAANVVNVLGGTLWNMGGGHVYIGGSGSSATATGNVLRIDGGVVTNLVSGGNALRLGYTGSGPVASNQLIVVNGGKLYAPTVYVGSTIGTAESVGNQVVVSNGATMVSSTLNIGSATSTGKAASNSVAMASGGLLEVGSVTIGAGPGNILTNNGGVLQFTTATPTITLSGNAANVIDSGTISFRAITNADVCCNQGGKPLDSTSKMTWAGANAFRLNSATNTVATTQSYVFETGRGATNFFRLELVNGTTRYRGMVGDSLTIGGAGGEMLCSNTAATVALPFTNNGTLTIVNSTLNLTGGCTFGRGSELNWSTNSGPINVSGGVTALPNSMTVNTDNLDPEAEVVMITSTSGFNGSALGWTVSPVTHRLVIQGTSLTLQLWRRATVLIVR